MAEQASRYQEGLEVTNTKTKKVEFPGAYKNGTKLLGLSRDKNEWKLVEIIDIRKTKLFLELANSDEDEDGEFVEKYDKLPVSEHPKLEMREMYWQKYAREFKKDQDEKRKIEEQMNELELDEKD